MAAEIREQPRVFARLFQEGRPLIAEVAGAIRDRAPCFVLLAARGSSDHAALYAKYLIETRLALPAGLVSPSTMTVYDTLPNLQDVLFIAISQSGSSPDLLESLTRARAGGAITLAVTNAPNSALAEEAEYHIAILAGPERAVAATKTYTAELLALYCLVEALGGGSAEEAAPIPEQAEAVLAHEPEVAELAGRYRFAQQLVVIARGYNYATARETALKLMETSYLAAQAFSAADLMHGPMAMIDRGCPTLALAPQGPGGAALKPVLHRLREVGADILVVGDPEAAGLGALGLPLPDLGPEILSPILLILPMQHFAWHLARERGSDPDHPRRLQKVTETW